MNGYERMLAEQREEIERLRGLALMVVSWLRDGLRGYSYMEAHLRSQAGLPPPPDDQKGSQ